MPLPSGSRGIITASSSSGGRRSRNLFFDRIVASRFRSKEEIGRLLRREEEVRAAERLDLKPNAYYLTGVHKGVYYRIKLPPQEQSRLSRLALPTVPQIPLSPLAVQPHAFRKIPTTASESSSSAHHHHANHHHHHHSHPPTVITAGGSGLEVAAGGIPLTTSAIAAAGAARRREDLNDFWWRLQEWWKENWSIVVLNLGSICSLIGFTRSDVLELRCFSMTGSLAAIVYNVFQKPWRWSPILWSGTFAVVNGVKIVQILLERNSTVQMTNEQQSIYDQFFMPHGITPKQFERIYHKAEMIHFAKDECLIRKGDKLEYVYLVVDGWTRANILGRYLTAGSFQPDNHKQGRSSGAWIGEIAFLEIFWNKEHTGLKRKSTDEDDRPAKLKSTATSTEQELTKTAANISGNNEKLSDKAAKRRQSSSKNATLTKPAKSNVASSGFLSLYTIVAKEGTTVLRWSHSDMEQLLLSSPDLRAGLTRAMTAAMAAKVIQFTLSRSNMLPTSWSAWLDDWKYAAPQSVAASVSSDNSPFNARGGAAKTSFSPKQDHES